MFYVLERYVFPNWVSTGMILSGDYRTHLVALEILRKDFKPFDFRAKHISGAAAMILAARGMTIIDAPDKITHV